MLSLISKLKAKPLSEMQMKAVAGGETCESQYIDTYQTRCNKVTGECVSEYLGLDYNGEICY